MKRFSTGDILAEVCQERDDANQALEKERDDAVRSLEMERAAHRATAERLERLVENVRERWPEAEYLSEFAEELKG